LLAGVRRNTVEAVPAQGWLRDPSGAHDERWFSAGSPTPLVRDGTVEYREDLPPDEQPRRRSDPVDPAAWGKYPAEPFYWPFWAVLFPCLVTLGGAGLMVALSLLSQQTTGFELASSAVAWVQADRVVQVAACLAAATLLVTLGRRPRWRRAAALAVWSAVVAQFGLFLLAGSQYPGNSCTGQPGWPAITLSDTEPGPVVTSTPGAYVIVTVPGWWTGTASDVSVDDGGVLREACTISLPGGGRRAIFAAIKPGTAGLASGPPASPAATPAWLGKVIVRGAPGR
jgi:hypothetical protein